MPHDRRSFIRRFGVALGSLIASGALPGCGKKKEGGSSKTESQVKEQDKPSPTPRTPEWEAEGQVTKQDKPSPISRTAEWEQLRQCWLSTETLSEDINRIAEPNIEGWPAARDAIPKRRIASHQASLNALVATGQLDEAVAKHMQVAFEEAVDHVVRSMMDCYYGLPIEHSPRADLLQQADVLRKISGDLDPATVAKAQAAVAQDVAFFEIFKAGPKDPRSLASAYGTRTLKVSPEALEAARLLAQLFMERPG